MSKIKSILENGSGGVLIDIESHLSNSLPNIVIVGFANKSVDEAKERIRGALASSQIKLPKKRITINLAPADIPKEGSVYDLPILLSILHSAKIIKDKFGIDSIILGEVSLDGSIRPVRGIIGKIISAKSLGVKNFWIPQENLEQANLIPDINILALKNVKEACEIINSDSPIPYQPSKGVSSAKNKKITAKILSIDEISEQEHAKRALLIAGAGHHNIMLNGPPGVGKSMLAKSIISIMPDMTQEEILQVTHIHSLHGKSYDNIVSERPFRSPHHSASHTSIVGGGQKPKPGEISLSHNGVLLFDEFPEFSRPVIESLRQPIEDHEISITRAKDSIVFPAHFLMIATANPCPCGYFGTTKECQCSPSQILNYQKKLSGPIIDRIDLYVDVDEIKHENIIKANDNNIRASYKQNIENAREIQKKRQNKLNSQLTNNDIKNLNNLSAESKEILDSAATKMKLSPRAYIRTIRVSQTIADLENSKVILPEHISEALQYRKREVIF